MQVSSFNRQSDLDDHLGRPCCPALRLPVGPQVFVQVRLAGVALGAVDAGVRADAAVRQNVLLQVGLPPPTFTALRTREGLLSWADRE